MPEAVTPHSVYREPQKRAEVEVQSKSLWRDAMRRLRHNRSAMVGLIIVVLLALVAIFAPVLSPCDPLQQDLEIRLQNPSSAHLLGTDDLGRDLLSRIVFGSRVSLQVGLFSVFLALVVGTLLGSVAGYFGGLVDSIVMRLMDVLLAFPGVLLAIGIVAVLGPSLTNAMIAIGVVSIPRYARVVRASVLTVKETEYVQAARAIGNGAVRILFAHILPNCLAPLTVQTTLGIATAILEAAGLSFLGLGAQPPTPEWGAMLAGARQYLRLAPWVTALPGIAIVFTVIGFNLLGDGLRDALDPRMNVD